MGLFSPKVPDTIGKQRGDSLSRRARIEEARRGGMLSEKALRRGKTTTEQRRKSRWS